MLRFEKTVNTDRDDTIKDSDADENNLIFISAEKTLTFLKQKTLSLITLKSTKDQTINCMTQDLKVLRQLLNLDKYNLNTMQAAQKKLNKIREFANVILAADNIINDNYFFKLPSETHFSDLMNDSLSADVVF
ncbi:uncharacterized protein BDCG_16652 [Blastomyces dermatitidis ER-3]|uniref:Uncharacterized protein n=1 Tax=Ajellomyces dermatitidis (strain ER-3 / ATCC MYA-2586) TaxID=559297 RepID=A0ABX2VTL8_AJEDR|nr:uncharacterized protein BDCG_16652 [Blastomyces dermatitidis ER-3]OAT00527.1 hypothetical protein BDCG_16652 [Blastomyces dermatitidis ER-3]